MQFGIILRHAAFAACAALSLVAAPSAFAGHRPQQEWRYTTSDSQQLANANPFAADAGRRSGVDANSNLFIVSNRSGTTACMVVTKVAVDTGAATWRRDLCGADGQSLAVDAAGNVVVGGIQNGAVFIVKLAGSNGQTIWTSSVATTGPALGSYVGLDGSGNPIVASVDGNSAVLVSRLSGTSGTVAWTARESTPDLSRCGFRGIAVNAAGASAYSYCWIDAQGASHLATSAVDTSGTRRWTVPGAGKVQAVFANGDVYDGQRRLAAANGATLWTGVTLASATLDPAENILGVQASSVMNGAVVTNYLVATRLSPSTGATAWSTSLLQPNVSQSAADVAVSLGTFIITNSPTITVNGQQRTGLQIVELDAFSGALLYNTIDANPNTRVAHRELAVGSAAYLTGTYAGSEVGVVAYFMSDSHPAADLNGDANADLAWRQQGTSNFGLWLMNGQSRVGTATVAGPPGAVIVQMADFDGDGKTDLLWRGPNGAYSITLMDGLTARSTTQILAGGSGWEVVAKGDFDNDRRADLVWKHPSQGYGVWLMNGATPASVAFIATPGPGFDLALTADFNHDARTDLVWTHPDGRAAITLMVGLDASNVTTILGPSTGWAPVATGDFNGDGRTDLVWRHADGSYGIWLMNGATATYAASIRGPGSGWTLAFARDFNRDGSTDLLWKNAAGTYEGWLMASDAVLQAKTLLAGGSGWSVVGSDDLDGDGRDDLLWRSASGEYGTWLMDGLDARSAASQMPGGYGWEITP